MFHCSKTWKFLGSTAYRQHLTDTHCNLFHGYSMSFRANFVCQDLDARNWAVDFGSLKPFKAVLEDVYDHTMLIASDDPLLPILKPVFAEHGGAKIVEVESTSAEMQAFYWYRYLNHPIDGWLKLAGYGDRIWCERFIVWEKADNSAWFEGTRDTWDSQW